MDALEVVEKAVVTALALDADLVTLVGTRVYRGSAPPGLENRFPYVLFAYASGGIQNDAPYDAVDMELMISGVDKTSTGAKAVFTEIAATLRGATLSYAEGWHSWSTVRQNDYFNRDIVIQNEEYKQVGSYFRFRISKDN